MPAVLFAHVTSFLWSGEGEGKDMPRLIAELIAEAPQFTNAVKDWEIDLRGAFQLDAKKALRARLF